MKDFITLFVISVLASFGRSHFVLQSPTSLGYDDAREGTSPCGSFDIANRDNVTRYPLEGFPIHVLTTHPKATFRYRVATVSNLDNWTDLIPPVAQTGVGDFCLPKVPGIESLVGQSVVIQVTQGAVDGMLYQVSLGMRP